MRDHENCGALLVQRRQHFHDLIAVSRVQVAGRLVSDDELWVPHDGTGNSNALLSREGVTPDNAEEALALARFVVEMFFNFDYRYVPSSVDSLTFAELNLVRVLSSTDEIPQGLRRFDADNGEALLYGKIPERVRGIVTPPRVESRGSGDWLISFYSWHPQVGELKRWEVRFANRQFVSLKDQTVEKWVSFTVENF